MEKNDETDETVEPPRLIVISGPLDFETVGRVSEQLAMFNALSREAIDIHVTSNGGMLDAGMALHDLFKLSRSPITTKIWGCADSAAVLAVQAGKVRLMAPNATMLLHKGSMGIEARLDEADFARLRKESKTNDERYAALVAKRSGKLQKAAILAMCARITTLNAKQALRLRLVDAIIGRRRTRSKRRQRTA